MVSMMTCSEQPNACGCFPWWEDDRRRMRCVVLMNMAVVGCAAVWVYQVQILSSEERADATARAHAEVEVA